MQDKRAKARGHPERLARYKVPSQIMARDELPHNMLGKVLRRVLRAEIIAGVMDSPEFTYGGPG